MSARSRLSLASPASSCPFDVLGTIFLYLRDSESRFELYLEDIIEVCRSWRIAALTNRRLWSRILICLQYYPVVSEYEMCKTRLQRYLRRSVAVPLSVEITLDTNYWPPHRDISIAQIRSLIMRISQEISRWESLSIDFKDQEWLHERIREEWEYQPIIPLESFICLPMPSLRRLSLCWVRDCLEDFLPRIPLLNAFETIGGDDTKINIPWSSLTSFRYCCKHYSNSSAQLDQLSLCVRLKDLYIDGIDLDERDIDKLAPAFDCTLPHVVSFHLGSLPSREPINTILANFRLPSLQNLTLVVPHAFWDRGKDRSIPAYMLSVEMSTAKHIVGFAGTCKTLTLLWGENQSHYERLKISSRYGELRSVIFDMFNAMPDLEELRLSEEISDVFLKVIKEEETLVPKLSRVFILDTGGVKVPFTLDGLASRWQRGENRKTNEVPSRYVLS